MVTLKILLLCFFTITPVNQINPMTSWLEKDAASKIEATYSPASKTISFDLTLDQPFSGEIALLEKSESPIYQTNHELPAGANSLDLVVSDIDGGHYLLLLHDFNQRTLQTLTLLVP